MVLKAGGTASKIDVAVARVKVTDLKISRLSATDRCKWFLRAAFTARLLGTFLGDGASDVSSAVGGVPVLQLGATRCWGLGC